MTFKNKNVWITGASSGIGEATAYEFAKAGTNLILSARRKEELQRVQAKCIELGAQCSYYILDLTLADDIKSIVKQVIETHKTIDVLFNNGGISQRSLFYETPIEVDRKVMEIDYFGHIALTKEVIPHMLKEGSGHLVVNTSVTGKFGFPLRSAYAAAKHALHGFFDSARAELAFKNINVTIVCPGRIQTNISLNAITKNGSKHGIMDGGQSHGIPVEKCARQIVKSIKNKRKEVYIGGKEILMVHIKRFTPKLYYKMAAKVKPT